MFHTFDGVPDCRKIEFPIAEGLQLGISIGLSLEGFVPVSCFPRLNFLLCAMDQLVSHLDKLPLYSDYRPKVIVRTAVGSRVPLDAGPQHTGDCSEALASMLETVVCRRVKEEEHAPSIYQAAYARQGSTLIVEG